MISEHLENTEDMAMEYIFELRQLNEPYTYKFSLESQVWPCVLTMILIAVFESAFNDLFSAFLSGHILSLQTE